MLDGTRTMRNTTTASSRTAKPKGKIFGTTSQGAVATGAKEMWMKTRVANRAEDEPRQDRCPPQPSSAPDRNDHEGDDRDQPTQDIDRHEARRSGMADPVGQRHDGDLHHRQYHHDAADHWRLKEAAKQGKEAEAADRDRQGRPDQASDEGRTESRVQSHAWQMPENHEADEAPDIRPLDDGQPEQSH